jgi:type II secretion system protein D
MKKNILAFCLSLVAFVASFELCAQGLNRRSSSLLSRGGAAAQPDDAVASGRSSDANAESKEAPALNWDGAPVDIVFQTYGEQVNKTILKDPAVPSATITLKSREGQKLTKEEYLEAIEVVLEMNGIHLEPYGEKFMRAIPRGKARKEGIPLYMDIADVPDEAKDGKVISVMLSFKSIVTDEAQKALEGFKSDNGALNVFERTNAILVTDTWQNIKRMDEIAKAIDISSPVLEQVFVYQVENASANDIKQALEQIVQESQKEQEKNGRSVQSNQGAGSVLRPSPIGGNRLLGNRQNNAQPEVKPVESLVTAMSDADRGMIRGKVLILADERSNKLVIITSKANYDFFEKVIKQLDVETTPDTVVKVYRLKYAEAEEVSDMINDLIGNASSSKSSSKSNQNAAAKGQGGTTRVSTPTGQTSLAHKSANQRTGEAKAGELSKENTTVLADKRINGLVVMTNKELVPVIEGIIEAMDVKLSQVLIETVIIEISLGDTLKTGIDWVMGGNVAASAFMNHGQMIGGGGGNTQLASFVNATTNAVHPVGNGIKYLMKSDKLNLAAVIEASKNDSHSKYIASPIVMTVDNKEATIEATANRQFLTGWSAVSSSYAGSGLPSPNYTAKDIGITLKITPKINPNGTVMLEVEEEYSQVSGKQSMLQPKGSTYEEQQIDVAVTRKMSADISLENGQSVILGGLTTKTVAESESGIPILKDIPWVGKWLFSKVEQDEQRSELLVFMTPYVLDDAESAQAEALRRKNVMSDASPWDDNGWSSSKLADPVSQREQLRRLKEEAKKQDADRASRRAIEDAKLKRARDLEGMDRAERDRWLEIRKEELEKGERRKLDEKMRLKDEKMQEELHALAREIRAKKLAAAEAEIKAAEKKD